jgi:hypothetical protein
MCSVDKVYHLSCRRANIKQQFLKAIYKAGILTSREPTTNTAAAITASTIRPTSHYSSQSDGGYASNGERKQPIVVD